MRRLYSFCLSQAPVWLVLAVLVMISAYANAQQQPERTYTLTFTTSEVNTIGTALIARPYSEVAGIMQKLQQQVSEQNKPAEPAK